MLIAGFGGRGVQFAGKLLMYLGYYTGKQVTLIPSYGPEARGGASNCSVCISDEQIASPLVTAPTALVVMNQPSFDQFEQTAAAGGTVFIDGTLVDRPFARTDLKYISIPATRLAGENDCLANVILCGRIIRELGLCDLTTAAPIVAKLVPAKKPELLEVNMRALEIGYGWA